MVLQCGLGRAAIDELTERELIDDAAVAGVVEDAWGDPRLTDSA